jgi:hypothetical protein
LGYSALPGMHEQSAIRPSIQTQHLQSGLARDLLSTHSKHSLTPGMNLQTELDAISSWGHLCSSCGPSSTTSTHKPFIFPLSRSFHQYKTALSTDQTFPSETTGLQMVVSSTPASSTAGKCLYLLKNALNH